MKAIARSAWVKSINIDYIIVLITSDENLPEVIFFEEKSFKFEGVTRSGHPKYSEFKQ